MSSGNLRIVDSDNVTTLPVGNLRDVAAAIHAFAECIEDGSISARKAIVVFLDDDGLIDFVCFGEQFDSAQGIGYLELAKAKVVDGGWRR